MKVALVIPVYNRANYLAQTIESALSQTWKDFNLTIWDDGSTDNSSLIATRYARSDSRLSVIDAPHSGVGAALKKAIAGTMGEYVGTLDSDDLLAPTALEETVRILNANPNTGMVYTNYHEIDDAGKVLGLGKRCKIPYSKDNILLDFMTFHFRLMRRTVYDAVGGFDSEFRMAPDYDLCLKLSEATNIYHLKCPLYFYRIHNDRISSLYRIEQIKYAYLAMTNALARRGMSQDWKIEFQPRFELKKLNC